MRDMKVKQMHDNLTKAIKISPDNTVAHLNKMLLEWQIGKIRDDEVLLTLKNEIRKLDPGTARLIFILFKKNVMGCEITKTDFSNAISEYVLNNQNASNLAKYLYEHPDFNEFKQDAQVGAGLSLKRIGL